MQPSEQLAASPIPQADTNIFVTPAPRPQAPAPTVPEFRPPIFTAPVATPAPVFTAPTATPASVYTTTTTTTTPGTITTREKKKSNIKWGSVIKGVAIVTAVALVGVGAYYGVSAAASWVLGQPLVAASIEGVASFMTPIANGLTNAGLWFTGFIGEVPGIVGGFFSELFGIAGTATGGAAVAATAGTAAATTVNTAGVASTVGAAGAGIAVLGTAKVAIPALANTPYFDQTNSLVTSSTAPTTSVHTDTGPLTADANHANIGIDGHGSHDSHLAADLGLHSQHIAHQKAHIAGQQHSGFLNQILHAKKTAIASAQTDSDKAASEDVSAPEPDFAEDEVLQSRKREGRSWKERFLGSNPYSNTLKSTGSHEAAILANRSNNKTEIASRGNSFSDALDADRARLDNALADAGR